MGVNCRAAGSSGTKRILATVFWVVHEWLKASSHSLNLKEASLWRYLEAFRFYRQLHKALTGPRPRPVLLWSSCQVM